MRNFSENSPTRFVNSLEKISMYLCDNFLSSSVLIDATRKTENFENRIRIKTREKKVLETLAILSWYKEPWIGWMIREEIEEMISLENSELSYILILLKSKESMILFLLDTLLYHSDEFFGFFSTETKLAQVLKISTSFVFKRTSKPKELVYQRHYKDKGSLKLPHEDHSIGPQVRLQQRIEESRQANLDTLAFLQGFLE